jgi:hypothetical protein
VNLRTLALREMPDSRDDVCGSVSAALNLATFLRTGPVLSYARTRETVTTWQATHESAECLYMIVSRGGLEPDIMEQFRSDEIGDVDGDQCPEFLDGWNQPIIFLRWAPGFSSPLSPVQVANATTHHDPFDPQRVDAAGYALVPLIVSGGPDRLTGLQVTAAGWSGLDMSSIIGVASTIGQPNPGSTNHLDNITNHDLNVK